MGMTSEQNAERVRAISSAYRGRAEAVRAGREREQEKAEKEAVDESQVEADETPDELPTESWKKDAIIQWLIDSGVEAERVDLEGLTKAELIENFIDAEG